MGCSDERVSHRYRFDRYGRRDMLRLAVVLALLLVAGCGPDGFTPTVTHPTKTSADFARDAYECDKDVAAVANHFRMIQMHRACMRQKGWVPQ